jgi:hypothetical protein
MFSKKMAARKTPMAMSAAMKFPEVANQLARP